MDNTVTISCENWLSDYGDMLYRYALLRVRDESVAEDLLQETLLAGIQSLDKFKGNATVSTWLTGILKYKIIDYYRKSQRDTPLDDAIDFSAELMNYQFDEQGQWQQTLADWKTPDKAMDNDEFWQVFADCQSRLPDAMAQLLIFRVLDGLSTEKCCQLLGYETDNQLWVTLSRTRMKLRQCLDVHWFNRGES